MASLDSSSYRRQDLLPHAPNSSAVPLPRRATVSSPAPSFTYTNTFESHRPHSRTERYGFDRPYPYRRSTISGHAQGHDVNDAPQLTARADDTMMWSDSASSSPIMSNTVVLQDDSPAPSSSCASPKLTHPTFAYDHMGFHHPIQSPIGSSFSLCATPEFPNNMDHPRTMPPAPLLSHNFRPSTGQSATASTTPALSPAASSTSFALDSTVEPSNPASPRHSEHAGHTLGHEEVDSELIRLRQRVRDLEFINDLVRLRVAELESDSKSRVHADLGLGLELTTHSEASGSNTSYPSSSSTPTTGPDAFSFLNQSLGPPPADWGNRTSARLRRFCALNRAGNALCAWHDSRRERRAHPPRMAPPNTLNCGCTYAEALFEESLARNGVGAFYPGESVRMDPALRNPLLKLLQDSTRMAISRGQLMEDGRMVKLRTFGSRRRRDRDGLPAGSVEYTLTMGSIEAGDLRIACDPRSSSLSYSLFLSTLCFRCR
ncbi:hypothetical protein JB92DRAFT_1440941 [Gautieria morchelliformis]|nr:hypothetical protein JB92DRAFT_1440941 [Gautieria morchelliformis]